VIATIPSEATRGARAVRDGPKYGGRRGGAPGGTEEAREFRIWRETRLADPRDDSKKPGGGYGLGQIPPLHEVGLLEMSGIRSITDLKGKRVGLQATGRGLRSAIASLTWRTEFPSMRTHA
jgi:hypothetical protein